MSFLSAAFARRLGTGPPYAEATESCEQHFELETAELFTDGGLDLFSEIELVETGEVVSVGALGDLEICGRLSQETPPICSKRLPLFMRTHEVASRGLGKCCGGWSIKVGFNALWARHTSTSIRRMMK